MQCKMNLLSRMVEMSYKVYFKFEPDYLYVQASGIRSIENIISLAQDYINASEEKGYKRVLVDVRDMTGELQTVDSYDLGKEAPDKLGGVHPWLKGAIVDLEKNRERYHFLETVLVNRGFHIRFFSNLDEAKRWLLEGKDTST